MSAGAKTQVTVNDVKPNVVTDAMQLKVEVTNLYIGNSTSKVYHSQANAVIPEYSIVKADIKIEDSDRTYQGSLSAIFYPNYGLVIKPLVITTETGDIYAHIEVTEALYNSLTQTFAGTTTTPEEVSITVQNSPMIYLVWIGVVLMAIAISVQFAYDLAPTKELPR
jgi:hypothetical protein